MMGSGGMMGGGGKSHDHSAKGHEPDGGESCPMMARQLPSTPFAPTPPNKP
jgi:hypothetical protein